MLWRMLGTGNVQYQAMKVNGRSYSAAEGQPLDVPDFDGAMLQANGWTFVAPSGPTAARPSGTTGAYQASRGTQFFDVSLGLLIEHDGTTWRNPATGAAV